MRTKSAGDSKEGIDYDNIDVERAVSDDPQLPVTIMRLTAVHGPGDYQHRLYPYLKRMDDGRRAILFDEALLGWRRAHVYVEDAAHAIALAVGDQRAVGGTYNVATGAFTEVEWVREIARVHGWRGELVLAGSELLPDALREDAFDLRQNYIIDSSRIRGELGYCEIASPDEALRRTIEWERQNPPELPEALIDYKAEDRTLAAVSRKRG